MIGQRVDDDRSALDRTYVVDLTVAQHALLRNGIFQWLGPARACDAVAAVVGFTDVADLQAHVPRLVAALDAGNPMTGRDWRRLLISTEIMFASDVLGCGVEWQTVTGYPDPDTLTVLRQLQRQCGALVRGRPLDGGSVRQIESR